MSHSPGPWVKGRGRLFVNAKDGYPIATIYPTSVSNPGQDDANVSLIVAAPEMLEALENLENDNGQAMPPSAWAKVQAAIAKAKGGA